MAEVDTQVLVRLLKLLERNVRAGEDLDPFPSSSHITSLSAAHTSKSVSPQKKSPKKAVRGKKSERSKSRTPGGEEAETEDGVHAGDGEAQELINGDLDKLAHVFDVARDSILAADCCIALLGSDRLTKQACYLIYIPISYAICFTRSYTPKNLSLPALTPPKTNLPKSSILSSKLRSNFLQQPASHVHSAIAALSCPTSSSTTLL